MTLHGHNGSAGHGDCCAEGCCGPSHRFAPSRRDFMAASGIALSAVAMTGLSWQSARAADLELAPAPARKPLVIKPVLCYETPVRREQTSWRSWGGIETQQQAQEEVARIKSELDALAGKADFPMTVLPVAAVRNPAEFEKIQDTANADTIILYPAGGPQTTFDAAVKTGKNVVFFIRHRSGPVYLYYEIISPRYLHQHTDAVATRGVDNGDVVVDSMNELQWRLRSLCGLKNALNTKVVCIGGPDGWAHSQTAPALAREKWKLDLQTVSYEELKPLLAAALADDAAVKLARKRTDDYLKDPTVKLETRREYLENAFIVDGVFRALMARAGTNAITINHCMGAIMPISRTTACMALSTLNDAGFQAYCESDFVVIPSGLLLVNISGRPNFLNDPTYPHDGIITLAHCTAPRRLDGRNLEPARILTHFESDYGASPKVEMRKGQILTNIIPDFQSRRYVGLRGEVVECPFLPICRSQIEMAYKVPDEKVALNMPGFHWMTVYGDYLREAGYALKKIGIGWEMLG